MKTVCSWLRCCDWEIMPAGGRDDSVLGTGRPTGTARTSTQVETPHTKSVRQWIKLDAKQRILNMDCKTPRFSFL